MVQFKDIEVAQAELTRKVKNTSKTTWKKFELKVAKDFGTNRTPLSGMVKSLTNSDTLHPDLYIECKYRNDDYSFWEEFEQRRKSFPDKIQVLCFNPNNKPVIHLFFYSDFFKLIEEEQETELQCTKKYRGVNTLFEQTIERASIEEKIPIVAIKKKGHDGYLIGISPKDFLSIQKILKRNVKRGITIRQSNRRRGCIGKE